MVEFYFTLSFMGNNASVKKFYFVLWALDFELFNSNRAFRSKTECNKL
jgi:hypothetical protein